MTEVNVDLLREQISKVHRDEIIDCYINDLKKQINFDIKKVLEDIDILIKEKEDENVFKLLDFQKKIFELVQYDVKKRLFHMIVAPTGAGKTITFIAILLHKIMMTNKDVIIMTKRKEILNQMKEKIPNNIKKIINNKIVNISFEPNIIDCVDKFDIEKINKKNDVPSIYIINFDKFTGSMKINDFKKVDFTKFSTLIIDESHWVGAERINELLTFIKNETELNVIGFSATPIRCNKKNKALTEKLFKKNKMFDDISVDKKINILYVYPYYNALKDNVICPVNWMPILIEEHYLINENEANNDKANNNKANNDEAEDDELDNNKNGNIIKNKTLNISAFNKVWDDINKKIIAKSFKKKGILWFRRRKDLLEFYCHMKDKISNEIKIFCTMTYEENEKEIKKLVDKCNLDKEHFNKAIKNFELEQQNSILLSVFRAIEGFDDTKVDFGIRMYYSNSINPDTETQRMGRMNRLCEIIEPDGRIIKKERGYFGTLEIQSDIETMKKNIILRLKNWIAFVRSWNDDLNNEIINTEKNIEIKKQLKEIMSMYIDANILEIYNIDIEKEVIQSTENLTQKFKGIKEYIKKQNIKSKDEYNIAIKEDINLIKNPDDYFEDYWIGWYDYLSIDTNNLIKDKTEWKDKCHKLNIKSIEDYYEKCKTNHDLPIYPNEIYYNFTNIENELNLFDINDYF